MFRSSLDQLQGVLHQANIYRTQTIYQIEFYFVLKILDVIKFVVEEVCRIGP